METTPTINKPSVGILLISTWKYNKFIDPLIKNIKQYFFRNSNIKIYLHTDSDDNHCSDKIIKIKHKPWPLITLNRFKLFCENMEIYETDYLVYLDMDVNIIDFVDEKILSDFFVTEHSDLKGTKGTPENNPKSTAFIDISNIKTYVTGSFFGGKKENFMRAAKIMKNNIDIDLKNNIIALWHDESHLNRYIIDHPDVTIIDHSYMSKKQSCNPKMMPYYDWEKGFNKFENMIHK